MNSRSEGALVPRDVAWLTLGAVVGPAVFAVAIIVLGFLRPGYSIVSQAISLLAINRYGGLMRLAFLFDGLLTFIGVIAAFRVFAIELGSVLRWTCSVLLLLVPLGIFWDGVFTMNSLAVHAVGTVLALVTPIVTFVVAGILLRRTPSLRRFGTWLLFGSPLTLGLLVGFVTSVPFSQMATGGGELGLWQRALNIEIHAWFVALSWLAFRSPRRGMEKKRVTSQSLGRP